jgi:hypothetical protein
VKSDKVIIVRNLFDQGKGSLVATIGDQRKVAAEAGQELIIGETRSAAAAMVGDNIGRRRIKTFELAGASVISSEFSLLSLLNGHSTVAHTLSNGSATDRLMAAKIMKMSVALNTITASHGPYNTQGR